MDQVKWLLNIIKNLGFEYRADGFAVTYKNLGFLGDPKFNEAYQWSSTYKWNGLSSPWQKFDLRWRCHFCIWAINNALHIKGDFVECGVDTGVFSGTIAKFFELEKLDREFFLFDTFEGIPEVSGMSSSEQAMREKYNAKHYFSSFDFVKEKFKAYPNVKPVRGLLPDTLVQIKGRKISYLSVDLNNAPSEKAVIETLWPQLSDGAIVVIDDYAFAGHTDQYKIWNEFATAQKRMIATLPTGQGLLVK